MADADGFFSAYVAQPPDGLLRLIGEFREDSRPDKIDLGVGVYRDASGRTPILKVVKTAEQRLWERQPTKAYLGPEGSREYAAALKRLVLGSDADGRTACVQTPGGTGALRLAMDLIARGRPGTRVWVGLPTWPNHLALLRAAGLEICTYDAFDVKTQTVAFDRTIETLRKARRGDVVLLHGCCHNPSGADFSTEQWAVLADTMAEGGLVPLIDLAYQGLGEGFDADGAGMRLTLRRTEEALVAYSCDKNFAMYRERVGALFIRTRTPNAAETVFSNALACARANWSMPPDHGAAVVQTVLDDAQLQKDWYGELETMRKRIAGMRAAVAKAYPAFGFIARQHGMFTLLPFDKATVQRLKTEHGIYMAASGRINVAGFTPENIPVFVRAVSSL